MMLAEVAVDEGEAVRAATLFAESLRLHEDNGDHFGLSWCLFGLGKMAAESARPQIAARLLGAAAALRQASGTVLQPTDRGPHDRYVTQLKADLGSTTFAAAQAAGRALPLEQAISEARAVATELAGTRPSELTLHHAEREEAV
jgi:hypothetical protein